MKKRELEERAEEERLHREERLFGEQRQQKDFWEVDEGAKKLRRHHVKKRKGAFNPSGSKRHPFWSCFARRKPEVCEEARQQRPGRGSD